MITINKLVIRNTKLSVYKDFVNGISILSNSGARSLECSTDEGMKLIADLNLSNFKTGWIYIKQICKNPLLNIKTKQNIEYIFNGFDKIFKDTDIPGMDRYGEIGQVYINNHLFDSTKISNRNEITFFDAPFIALEDNWLTVEYKVMFTTYFLFNEFTHSPYHPLLSFDWMLGAIAFNDEGIWKIVDNNCFSDENTIRKSVLEYDTSTIFLYDINNLPCLKTAVSQFLKENKLLELDANRDNPHCCYLV